MTNYIPQLKRYLSATLFPAIMYLVGSELVAHFGGYIDPNGPDGTAPVNI